MKAEIIKAEDYGLETSKANELTVGLKVVKAERELLIKEFEEVSKLELIVDEIRFAEGLELEQLKANLKDIHNALNKLKYDDFESLPTAKPD